MAFSVHADSVSVNLVEFQRKCNWVRDPFAFCFVQLLRSIRKKKKGERNGERERYNYECFRDFQTGENRKRDEIGQVITRKYVTNSGITFTGMLCALREALKLARRNYTRLDDTWKLWNTMFNGEKRKSCDDTNRIKFYCYRGSNFPRNAQFSFAVFLAFFAIPFSLLFFRPMKIYRIINFSCWII